MPVPIPRSRTVYDDRPGASRPDHLARRVGLALVTSARLLEAAGRARQGRRSLGRRGCGVGEAVLHEEPDDDDDVPVPVDDADEEAQVDDLA